MWNFHMKIYIEDIGKILADFQINTSVPLNHFHFPNILTDTAVILEDKVLKNLHNFKVWNQWNLRKMHATRLKSMNNIPFIWWSNAYVLSKCCNQISRQLLHDIIMLLNHHKVPRVVNAFSGSKEGGLCWLKDSRLT